MGLYWGLLSTYLSFSDSFSEIWTGAGSALGLWFPLFLAWVRVCYPFNIY